MILAEDFPETSADCEKQPTLALALVPEDTLNVTPTRSPGPGTAAKQCAK